jgi:hypothetical protein
MRSRTSSVAQRPSTDCFALVFMANRFFPILQAVRLSPISKEIDPSPSSLFPT